MCGGDDLTGRSMCCGSACVGDGYGGGRCDYGVIGVCASRVGVVCIYGTGGSAMGVCRVGVGLGKT